MSYKFKTWYERVNGYTGETSFIYVTYQNKEKIKYDVMIFNDTQDEPYISYEDELDLDEWDADQEDYSSIKEVTCIYMLDQLFTGH